MPDEIKAVPPSFGKVPTPGGEKVAKQAGGGNTGVSLNHVEAFFRAADANGDGVITDEELRGYNQLKGLALLGANASRNRDNALRRFHQHYDPLDQVQTMLSSFPDELYDAKKSGYSLEAIRRVAKQDGNPDDLSLEDLAGKKDVHAPPPPMYKSDSKKEAEKK